MNFIDVIIILIVVLAVWSGFRRGFVLGFLNLVTWIGSLIAVVALYPYMAGFLDKYFLSVGAWSILISFLITLLLVRLVVAFIINSLLSTIPAAIHYNWFNKILGVLPGLVNGVVYAALFATFLLLLPLSAALTDKVQDSPLANKLSEK